jgi:hypothetical protein
MDTGVFGLGTPDAPCYVHRIVRSRVPHRRAVALTALLPIAALGLTTGGALGASGHAASSMTVKEHVTLKLVKRTGSTKFEHSGRATGTVAGTVRTKITLTHSVVLKGTVTIATSKGKLRLKVDGRARSIEQRSPFDGKATILAGTGRYAHARGTGTFSGVVNRSTWAAKLDAKGTFTY